MEIGDWRLEGRDWRVEIGGALLAGVVASNKKATRWELSPAWWRGWGWANGSLFDRRGLWRLFATARALNDAGSVFVLDGEDQVVAVAVDWLIDYPVTCVGEGLPVVVLGCLVGHGSGLLFWFCAASWRRLVDGWIVVGILDGIGAGQLLECRRGFGLADMHRREQFGAVPAMDGDLLVSPPNA